MLGHSPSVSASIVNEGRARHFTPLQIMFLVRLSRLVRLRRRLVRDQAADARLLDKATYSTYCDCVAAGVTDDARRLLIEGVEGVGTLQSR